MPRVHLLAPHAAVRCGQVPPTRLAFPVVAPGLVQAPWDPGDSQRPSEHSVEGTSRPPGLQMAGEPGPRAQPGGFWKGAPARLLRAGAGQSSRPSWPPVRFVICCRDGKLPICPQGAAEAGHPDWGLEASPAGRRAISGPPAAGPAQEGAGLLLGPRVQWLRVDPRNQEAEPGMMACPQGPGSHPGCHRPAV